MNTQKTLTFKTILISYLALCAVLIAITSFGYGSSISYMKKETVKSAQQELKSFVNQIENNIQQTYKICDTLAAGTDLKELSQIKHQFSPEQILKSKYMQQTMRQINIQNNLYQDLHIYFYNSDSILSSMTQRREGAEDISLFCKSYGLSSEEFYQLLASDDNQMCQFLPDDILWLLRPVYDEAGNTEAVIIAEYKGSRLVSKPLEDRILFIHANENIDLQCLGTISKVDKINFARITNTFQSIRIQNTNYIGISQSMNLFNWTCSLAIPNTLFWNELYHFAFMLILEILALLAAALICSWYFSKKTFSPITSLLQANRKLSRKAKNSANLDLARYLSGITDEFPGGNPALTETLMTRDSHGYLMSILSLGPESEEILGHQGIDPQDEDLEQFVLENIMNDLIFHRYPGIVTAVDKNYVILLKLHGVHQEKKEIYQLFRNLEQFYIENLQISMKVMVGDAESDYQKMNQVYQTLLEGIQYLDFWNSQKEEQTGVYLYGEILESDEHTDFPSYVNGSRRLLNCLESEDFQGAYKELDTIYHDSFPKHHKYLQQNMYRMYGLIGILISTIDIHANESDQQFYQSLHYEERLFRIQSIHELLSESRAIFEQIIEYKESQSKENEPDWLMAMLDYIEHHFQDLDLNVSKLAQEFHLSVPHLSRAFKSQMGKGVLEYIHTVKIAHAKEMLKNDCNIKNTAAAVGYSDSQALTRAFKRYEGITPSQYKELSARK